MDESTLRKLAQELRAELPNVIADEKEQSQVAAEIDAALAVQEAREALRTVLRARPETRAWVAGRLGVSRADVVRSVPGLAGGVTAPLGVHVVCPAGHYDRYVDGPTDDPGYCPVDGLRLVRADY